MEGVWCRGVGVGGWCRGLVYRVGADCRGFSGRGLVEGL